MEQNMKALGKTVKLMDMESSFMFSAISTKVSGKETRLMVKESLHM
jgi:hypothetical protein